MPLNLRPPNQHYLEVKESPSEPFLLLADWLDLWIWCWRSCHPCTRMGCVGVNTQCVLVHRRAAVIKVEVWEIIHCEIVAADNLHDRGIQNGGARLDIVQPQPFINHSQPSLVGIQYPSSRERERDDLLLDTSVYTIPKSPPTPSRIKFKYLPSESWTLTPKTLCWLLIIMIFLFLWTFWLKREDNSHVVVNHL